MNRSCFEDKKKAMNSGNFELLDEISKQIRDLYEKVEEKKELPKENIEVIEDDRIDKAYVILNRITIILFIIFMILFIAFISFVIYICTY